MSDQPTTVRVEMTAETMQKLAELLPAVSLWAEAEGGEAATGPGDVIGLAIGLMHAQVFQGARDMLAEHEAGGVIH